MAETRGSKNQTVKEGRMPVSEFLFDRAGAGSPYGEDLEFPLPVKTLAYRHSDQQPQRKR
ncbi:MAG: hypothetical protein ACRDT8_06695 [Micromonosporaceae bacterium]